VDQTVRVEPRAIIPGSNRRITGICAYNDEVALAVLAQRLADTDLQGAADHRVPFPTPSL